ncbi:hypothetical protein OESDEN_07220 [Oesophagostomum dentatum]|uniref:Uncharacterized protein n=1 Tax=Oesophagostomum dentatum TaxID=61180 RepID=A0A0B1T6L1_OESDE|nr:hypothetical protein OESDEN_07220 [Oesophagostomum dentatum]
MSLRPSVIELTHSRNPLSNLTAALRSVEAGKLDNFFGKMKMLSLDRTDIAVNDLIFLLQKLKLLEGFSFSELDFSQKEWELLLPEFQRLSIRAMDISQDILDLVLNKMNVELLKLSAFPGLKVDALKHSLFFVYFAGERLKHKVDAFRILNLQCFAVVLYTPCNDTKYASGELARLLAEAGLPTVQLHRFASKGLSQGHDNFTVITAGEDCVTRAKVHSIYVEGRTSTPNLRQLLQLIDDFSPPLDPIRVVEFGGFDTDGVRKAFEAARQDV